MRTEIQGCLFKIAAMENNSNQKVLQAFKGTTVSGTWGSRRPCGQRDTDWKGLIARMTGHLEYDFAIKDCLNQKESEFNFCISTDGETEAHRQQDVGV